ncbi:MAG: transposase [Crocinitomicaceae bacterium]|nr:transposase [Crocinitomicaceae bacterium]
MDLNKIKQHALIERFNGSYRKEVLNTHLFTSLNKVRDETQKWIWTYNNVRPHKSLGYLAPVNFVNHRRKTSFPTMIIDEHLKKDNTFMSASN